MLVVLADPLSYKPPYLRALRDACPDHQFHRWPDVDPEFDHHVLVTWDIPDAMRSFPPSLRAIFCYAAGTDQLLLRPRLPITVPVVRLVDDGQADQLLDYAMHAALARLQDDFRVRTNQRLGIWEYPDESAKGRGDLKIAVMGLGMIGGSVARGLASAGFKVSGWSRSARTIDGVRCFHGDSALATCVDGADLLVNLLPSNPQTHGILSGKLFDRLHQGAWLVNLGRGDQLDEAALRSALEGGWLGGAWLDVFSQEPLPHDHWMWSHPLIRMTPHCGGLPTPHGTARCLSHVLAAIERGHSPLPGEISPVC